MRLVAIYLAILLLLGVGFIKNIIKLIHCDFEAPYKCEIIHIIGLAPPVGAITGWVNVGK